MNIGVDIRSLMDVEYSGVSEYTHNLLKELLRHDKKNHYKLFYNSAKDIAHSIPSFRGSAEIVNTKYPNKIFNYLLQKGLKYPCLDKMLDVDVFLAPHINFSTLSKKCKKIITVHDLSYLRYGEFFSLRKNFWHYMINAKKILKDFDIIVAISENTKRDLIELLNIPESKIEVIYSGISDDYSAYPDNNGIIAVKRKYNLPDNFIFYLGAIEPRKNVGGIIKSFEEYIRNTGDNELNLVIAGASGWKNEKIFKALKNGQYRDRVRFLGYIDEDDKKYIYRLTKIFLFPSFYEGFGFPPLEAMKCGTPVITSNISSLPEVVRDAAVMVDPTNAGEGSEAISLIMGNEEISSSLSRKSIENSSFFTWKDTAIDYLKLF